MISTRELFGLPDVGGPWNVVACLLQAMRTGYINRVQECSASNRLGWATNRLGISAARDS